VCAHILHDPAGVPHSLLAKEKIAIRNKSVRKGEYLPTSEATILSCSQCISCR
jgi:hypothetical protein